MMFMVPPTKQQQRKQYKTTYYCKRNSTQDEQQHEQQQLYSHSQEQSQNNIQNVSNHKKQQKQQVLIQLIQLKQMITYLSLLSFLVLLLSSTSKRSMTLYVSSFCIIPRQYQLQKQQATFNDVVRADSRNSNPSTQQKLMSFLHPIQRRKQQQQQQLLTRPQYSMTVLQSVPTNIDDTSSYNDDETNNNDINNTNNTTSTATITKIPLTFLEKRKRLREIHKTTIRSSTNYGPSIELQRTMYTNNNYYDNNFTDTTSTSSIQQQQMLTTETDSILQSSSSSSSLLSSSTESSYQHQQLSVNQQQQELQENQHNQQRQKQQQQNQRRQKAKIQKKTSFEPLIEHRPSMMVLDSGFNVVLTHCTADFDTLASAVGLAKLWSVGSTSSTISSSSSSSSSSPQSASTMTIPVTTDSNIITTTTTITNQESDYNNYNYKKEFDSASHVPTFVVLPRGAHPGVQRFLSLHKYFFPIRSLKSLPNDLTKLNRLGLVDAQRRDRVGPAVHLLEYANRITIVDHHVDQDSDIVATDYVVDTVGSVTTIIVERLQDAGISLTEPEATLMALGIHGDTGSLCFDSTTVRDASALTWCLQEGASQTAIAEHAQTSLSIEQQGVLTQALIQTNTTQIHGVTVSTATLISPDGFIQGLASVTQDALELSSSDVFLLGLVYETKSSLKRNKKRNNKSLSGSGGDKHVQNAELLTNRWLANTDTIMSQQQQQQQNDANTSDLPAITSQGDGQQQQQQQQYEHGNEEYYRLKRLRVAFDRLDATKTGYIERIDISLAISSSGIVLADPSSVSDLINAVDTDNDGKIDFNEFVQFATRAEQNVINNENKGTKTQQGTKNKKDPKQDSLLPVNAVTEESETDALTSPSGTGGWTMIIIGRVRAGINTKAVKLNKLLERFGGGGHPKAASATVRIDNEKDGLIQMQQLVNELIDTSLSSQPTVRDFMTSPVLTVQQHMNVKQVEDMFHRYAVRALPVVDDNNNVIGLVTYQLVEAASQRLLRKRIEENRKERQRVLDKETQTLILDEEHTVSVLHNESIDNSSNISKDPKYNDQRKKAANSSKNNNSGSTSTTGSTVKGWMLQHVQTVEENMSLAQVETILLESDVGSLPVVASSTTGSKQLVGMVTRTDLLRQRRYYDTLPYYNQGFADSVAARRPIIELRKRLKQFDLD